jgi:uncharacterized membrane protein (DUF106 family)
MELRLKPTFGGFFTGFILIALLTFFYYFLCNFQISNAILSATGIAIINQCIAIKPKYKERTGKIVEKTRLVTQSVALLLISIIIIIVIFELVVNKENNVTSHIANLDNRILVPILALITISLSSSAIKSFKKL